MAGTQRVSSSKSADTQNLVRCATVTVSVAKQAENRLLLGTWEVALFGFARPATLVLTSAPRGLRGRLLLLAPVALGLPRVDRVRALAVPGLLGRRDSDRSAQGP